jgi:hypothetical protein
MHRAGAHAMSQVGAAIAAKQPTWKDAMPPPEPPPPAVEALLRPLCGAASMACTRGEKERKEDLTAR